MVLVDLLFYTEQFLDDYGVEEVIWRTGVVGSMETGCNRSGHRFPFVGAEGTASLPIGDQVGRCVFVVAK